jgi:hypothetical protein
MSDVTRSGDAKSISPNTQRLVIDVVRRSFQSQPQGLETRHQERVKEFTGEQKKVQPDGNLFTSFLPIQAEKRPNHARANSRRLKSHE